MLYEPIQIEHPGVKNQAWGIGVITPLGAYITSKIPPFERIYADACVPKKTVFTAKNQTKIDYRLPPNIALGEKKLTAYIRKPKPHYEELNIKLTKIRPINFIIYIEEISVGRFKVLPFNLVSQTIFQPYNGWTTLF